MVAKGIQTAGELETIRAMGIKLGQGFLFPQALPEAAFRSWVGAFATRRPPDPAPSLAGQSKSRRR